MRYAFVLLVAATFFPGIALGEPARAVDPLTAEVFNPRLEESHARPVLTLRPQIWRRENETRQASVTELSIEYGPPDRTLVGARVFIWQGTLNPLVDDHEKPMIGSRIEIHGLGFEIHKPF